MWLGLVIGLLLGAMGAGLLLALEKLFYEVGARVWVCLQSIVAAVALLGGAWTLWSVRAGRVSSTTCHIVESEAREGGDADARYIEVRVRVKWTAEGRSFTMREFSLLSRFDAAEHSREELAARYAPGASFVCSYRLAKPSYVHFAPREELLGNRKVGACILLTVGAVLLVVALRPRRRRHWRHRSQVVGTSGALGLALVGLCVGGMILSDRGHGEIGIPVAALAAIALLALIVRETILSDRALDRVRALLEDGEHWTKPEDAEREGWDPHEGDRVTGLLDGCRVWAELTMGGASAEIVLEHWPPALQARARDAECCGEPTTGDADFDERVVIDGAEHLWRPLLTSEVRIRLARMLSDREGALHAENRRLLLQLTEAEVEDLDAVIEDAVKLANALVASADVSARVFDLAQNDPVPEVRLGHYRWLVEQKWEAPHVLRTAARDDSAEIAEWARAQLPPAHGAYR